MDTQRAILEDLHFSIIVKAMNESETADLLRQSEVPLLLSLQPF